MLSALQSIMITCIGSRNRVAAPQPNIKVSSRRGGVGSRSSTVSPGYRLAPQRILLTVTHIFVKMGYFTQFVILPDIRSIFLENDQNVISFKRADWQDQNLEQEVQMLGERHSAVVIRGQTATLVASTGKLMGVATIGER